MSSPNDLIRQDFPSLAKHSNETIDKIIIANFSVLSNAQYRLEDILISRVPDPFAATTLYHPLTYRRAALATFRTKEKSMGFGLIDLKGTGHSPEGEEDLNRDLAMLGKLQGVDRSLTEKRIEKIREGVEKEHKRIRTWELQRSAAKTPEERRWLSHRIHNAKARNTKSELFLEGLAAIEKDASSREHWVQRYIEHLRGLDYTNGVAAADRLVKEVVVERAAHTLFQEYNAKNKANAQTVRSYFVLAMPYDILLPNGETKRAGIIGRQAHWRDLHYHDKQNTLPREIIGSVLQDADQFDLFGRMVDFELPEIKDPRVNDVLGWNDIRGQKIEQMTADAMNAFTDGDKNAVRKLVESTLAPLGPIPLEQRDHREIRSTDHFEQLWQKIDPEQIASLTKSAFLARVKILLNHKDNYARVSALLATLIPTHAEWVADALIQQIEGFDGKHYDLRVIQTVVAGMLMYSNGSVQEVIRVMDKLGEKSTNIHYTFKTMFVEIFLRLETALDGMALQGLGVLKDVISNFVAMTAMINRREIQPHIRVEATMNGKTDDGEEVEIDVVRELAKEFGEQPYGEGRDIFIRALFSVAERLSGKDLQQHTRRMLVPLIDLLENKEGYEIERDFCPEELLEMGRS